MIVIITFFLKNLLKIGLPRKNVLENESYSIQEINSCKKIFSYAREDNFPRNLKILRIGPICEKFLPVKIFSTKHFLTIQTVKDCTTPVYFLL